MIGFCLTCADDVEIGADRRCLTDGSLCLPPSNSCQHRRLIGGAWSECLADLRGRDAKPCKPVAAGTWRNILAQQQKAEAKRERDRITTGKAMGQHGRLRTDRTLSAFPSHEGAPKLATAHKPQREPIGTISCPTCQAPFRPKLQPGGKRQRFCSRDCAGAAGLGGRPRAPISICPVCGASFKASMRRGQRQAYCTLTCQARALNMSRRLDPIPCPVCSTPFKPRVVAKGGRRQKVCSQACGNALQLGTTRPNYQRRAS